MPYFSNVVYLGIENTKYLLGFCKSDQYHIDSLFNFWKPHSREGKILSYSSDRTKSVSESTLEAGKFICTGASVDT